VGLRDALGLNETANPGADAKLLVNQQPMASATGSFALDQGRLRVDLTGQFGENLPLRVTDSLGQIEDSVAEIAATYNVMRQILAVDPTIWANNFADKWRQPFLADPAGFDWLGFNETGKANELWIDGDAFAFALTSDPARAEGLLWASADKVDGLVPTWKGLAKDARAGSLDALMIAEPDPKDSAAPVFPWRGELENEKEERLLDLFG